MISSQAREFHSNLAAYVAAMSRAAGLSLAEQRDLAEGFSALTAEPSAVTWEASTMSGVDVIWALPSDPSAAGTIVYAHGGGFAFGSARGYRNFTGQLANATGCRVVSVEYRLAPEHPYPAGLNDLDSVYREVIRSGSPPSQVFLAGDSAGGGLALATVLRLRDANAALPAGLLLFSPWTDLELSGDSMTKPSGRDMLASREGMAPLAQLYAGGSSLAKPCVSPLNGNFEGLCPMFIEVGGDEALLDDSVRVHRKALESRVSSSCTIVPGMQHVFAIAAGTMPEADQSLERAGVFVRAQSTNAVGGVSTAQGS